MKRLLTAMLVKIASIIGVTIPTWATLTGKPATFPPATHTHEAADLPAVKGTRVFETVDEFLASTPDFPGQFAIILETGYIVRGGDEGDWINVINIENLDADSIVTNSITAASTSTFTSGLRLGAGAEGRVDLLTDPDSHSVYFQWRKDGSPYDFALVQFLFGAASYSFNGANVTAPRVYGLPDASGTLLLTNATTGIIPGSYANDAAAASAGVPVGFPYHTTGAVKVRLS